MSFGELFPKIVEPPPGPRARALCERLGVLEAPGVNTLAAGGAPSILWQEACGANVLDVDGNIYIDLTSGFGVAAVGHRHRRVVAAVTRQAGLLLHGLGDVHAHPLRVDLAFRLLALAPLDEPRIFFAVSGAEAVEIALKTALATTGRPGILAFDPSYHGLTMGALAATSRPEFRTPFAAHLHRHVRRLPYGCATGRAAAILARGATGAVLVEPIVGREGVLVPPPGWLAALSELCRAHGALLVADEILTGFGRTGTLFAVEHEAVRPDLLCCGKALGGGLPIAAVLARQPLFGCWQTGGEALHTSTFLANPLACAAALAVLEVLERERLPERARRLGAAVGARLQGWPRRFRQVAATRGRGLLWGVELRSRQAAARCAAAARDRGVLLLSGGPAGRVLQILPPLTITPAQLDRALEILEASLDAAPDEAAAAAAGRHSVREPSGARE
ncbi:MAG TPA: aspartate aminotransferase family protein [Thermoanaerobaculia bacterium]|nr:aspartate aminotransferase family protein [Thermoanaerobaculia bacterium]